MKEIARHYLTRAMAEAHGNKTKAAELVGLPSYQTLTNWLDKYDVEV
jgi:DNA-binding protein Fis